jgi:hypothetical protein
MGDTWITDMRHFLDERGQLGRLPNRAMNIVLHLGSIVEWMTCHLDGAPHQTNVRCRRSPGRRRCVGAIHADFEEDGAAITWFCPLCEDNGVIRGWKETPWDRSSI